MKRICAPKAAGRHLPFNRPHPCLVARPWTIPIAQQAHAGRRPCWPSSTITDISSRAHWLHSSSRSLSEEIPNSEPSPVTSPKSPTDHTYLITFTCRRCFTRSSHEMSGQAYHKGTVLIACPGCKNRHVISDHLMIFSERERSLEEILKEKGEEITKATASSEADLEFLEDGSVKARVPTQLEGQTPMTPTPSGWPKGLSKAEVEKARGGQS